MEKFMLTLSNVSFTQEEVERMLHLEDAEEEDIQRAMEMAEELASVAVPKGMYAVAQITDRGADWVELEGRVRFVSELVAQNLEGLHRVVPYMCTCGVEAEEWSRQFDDPLEQFWAEEFKLRLVGRMGGELNRKVREQYYPQGKMASMNPGSIKEWPLKAQGDLFDLLEDPREVLGVSLTDSYLMLPHKSISGFYFANDAGYENCSRCPIIKCPNRRAAYKPE